MSIIKSLLKEFEQKDKKTVILTPDDTLFHGTGEDFPPNKLSRGGDGVLWTTTSSLIAQTYIPVAGSTSFISTRWFTKPHKSNHAQKMQKQLGIEFTDVTYNNEQPTSWKTPTVFRFKPQEKYNEKLRKLAKGETDRAVLTHLYKKHIDIDKLKNEYVNEQLGKLGYSPEDKDDYDMDHRWILKTSGDKILPFSYRKAGRLFILKPQQQLKLFDLTEGESKESDLLDLDYHKYDIFEEKEAEGYDGIKITDFAQVDQAGNVGHLSYGLFAPSLSKIKIFDIIKVHHPDDFGERSWNLRTRHSKEYEDYLKNEST